MGTRGPRNYFFGLKALAWWIVVFCCVTVSVHAAMLIVTTTNDNGAGSLRQTLVAAHDNDTITFAVTGSIVLTSGELLVDKSITIAGPGLGNLAVDGNVNSRVFHVGSGKVVSISGLTIKNGRANGTAPDGNGGGIYNDHATLMLTSCLISGNSASGYGGGLYNDHLTVTLTDCQITGNSAGFGSGIFNDGFGGSATLRISNSSIENNSALHNAGGIYNDASSSGKASLAIDSSTLAGNSALFGGGILNDGFDNGSAVLSVINSTFSSNSADASGGGVYNHSTAGNVALMLNNSTFDSNSAENNGGGIYSGDFSSGMFNVGGNARKALRGNVMYQIADGDGRRSATIANGAGGGGTSIVEISNTTFNGNSASVGGSIYNFLGQTSQATVYLANTILKAGANGGNISDDQGTVSSHGYNLSNDGCGGFLTGPGDQVNTEPMLGLLQDNGGPTLTHALLPGSPAIDAGGPSFTPLSLYDQRGPGFHRVVNGHIDIGSFEVQEGVERPGLVPRPRPVALPRPTPR
jgi:predicted outer membrane repeat protein